MLAALVEERKDHGDPVRFSAGRGNDALEILKMVVRGHMVFLAADLIGNAVIRHVAKDEEITAADRIEDRGLSLTGTVT